MICKYNTNNSLYYKNYLSQRNIVATKMSGKSSCSDVFLPVKIIRHEKIREKSGFAG